MARPYANNLNLASRQDLDLINKEFLFEGQDGHQSRDHADLRSTASMDCEKGNTVPQERNSHESASFPDGGLHAWLVVLGAWCGMFVSFGWIGCIGIFQDYYQLHKLSEYPPSTVAWITSMETFMMFLGGPIVGKLFDNYGPRCILLGGTFLHVFGLMMTSISSNYYQFLLAQGVCSAIGASAIFYASLSSVGTWFFVKRATAFGIVASGSSMGGLTFPIIVPRLIKQVGFPWTMRICAFLILGLLMISNLTVKSRLPPQPAPFTVMEFIRPLREARFLLLVIGSFIIFFVLFLPSTYLILQGEAVGMSSSLAQYLIPILNGVSVFGRVLPGILADRIGRFNITIVMTFISAVLALALWIPARSSAPIIVFAALYGFSSAAFVSMAPALVAQISDIKEIGTRTGTLFGIVSLASLAGSPIGGAIVAGGNESFLNLQIYLGVMMFLGTICFVASRIIQEGFQWKFV